MNVRRGRRLGDGKRAICGREPDVAVPGSRFPTDAEWQVLQDKLGFQLSDSLRSEINTSSVFYWLGAPQSHSLIKVTTASNAIDKWRRNTKVLRNIIWKQSIERSAPTSFYDEDSLRRFFAWSDMERFRYDPLSLLAIILDASIVVANLVVEELNNSDSDLNETLNWYLWASHLISVLRKQKIPAAKTPSVIHIHPHSRRQYGVIFLFMSCKNHLCPSIGKEKQLVLFKKESRMQCSSHAASDLIL